MIDSKIPCQSADYQMEVLDDEIILFNQSGLKIMHSNQTGAIIWQLCDGQRNVADIVEILTATYPTSADEIHSDVYEILTILATHNAITWV
ncbi:MAG: PqqD family protein [Chloroflexi bacterium]|nr:MAG: PqqD family protein [Chloroflexota bacterium]